MVGVVADAGLFEVAAEVVPVGLAGVAEVVRARGSLVYERLAPVVLAVEESERVAVYPADAVLAEGVAVAGVVRPEPVDVGGPALRVADGVDGQREVGQADLLQKAPAYFDHLGVNASVGFADDLDSELCVLAIAARLRTLVPEHGADVE